MRVEDSVVACRLASEVVQKRWSGRSSLILGVACLGFGEVRCPEKETGYVGLATVCLEETPRQIGYLHPIEHHLVYR